MTPLTPTSLKLTQELHAEIHAIAEVIGYSDSRFMTQAIQAVVRMIQEGDNPVIPRLVVLARSAQAYEAKPPRFK